MTKDEIAKRLIESRAIDFGQIGSVLAEIGPDLARSQNDLNMVLIGRPIVLACFLTAFETPQFLEELRKADIAGAMSR